MESLNIESITEFQYLILIVLICVYIMYILNFQTSIFDKTFTYDENRIILGKKVILKSISCKIRQYKPVMLGKREVFLKIILLQYTLFKLNTRYKCTWSL